MDSSCVQLQEMSNQSMENMLVCSKSQQERKARPQPEEALKCPRCDSSNTKFCYYNNYSLTQPRYFCKSCRRYWTKGGTLRNVPVGGGCRKNKRPSSSSSSATSKRSSTQLDIIHQPIITTNNTNPLMMINTLPSLNYDTTDLSLAFARLHKQSGGLGEHSQLGFDHLDHHNHHHQQNLHQNQNQNHHLSILGNPTSSPSSSSPAYGNFLGTYHGNFQNLYYGNVGGGGGGGGDEIQVDRTGSLNGEMGLGYNEEMMNNEATNAVTTMTPIKQEINGYVSSDHSKLLWGFPWQSNNVEDHILDHAGRESWINGFNSSWHGLVNSPLM